MQKIFQAIAVLGTMVASLSLPGGARALDAGQLTVEVDGLTNQQGNICLTVFSRSDGFPKDAMKALKASCFPISQTPLTLTLDGLNFGNYAVALFHDENADGELNTNQIGIPQEGFGFSNNPPILTGPPQFRDATFFLAGQNTTIRIDLNYLL
ncbi:DUF2141 domain-containing protein [Phormidium sp. CCY1219]|uniref:DUF2141 domain-containing protein n=1 Tax=Phormidium sp. CCY1219 TaxID=2886104 RepID=UPI002D1F669A|nr:DUF2141 domain-containing protein [Phormidium sp. CCY1219]MEB3831057.1 DUF2141 domain-containing protein [Phormidium sp. CCY1219]